MKTLIWLLVILLLVAHQDHWFWYDLTLVFGFMPIGLFYHACLSLATGLVWYLACVFSWPEGLDDLEEVGIAATKSVGKRGQAS